MAAIITDLGDQKDGENNVSDITKRHINIDDAKVAALMEEVGTKTITATVDFALREVLALIERRRWLIKNMDIDYSPLADDEFRRSLWERKL